MRIFYISNLEVLNANMIESKIPQNKRLEKQNIIAQKQLKILINDKNVIGIDKLKQK